MAERSRCIHFKPSGGHNPQLSLWQEYECVWRSRCGMFSEPTPPHITCLSSTHWVCHIEPCIPGILIIAFWKNCDFTWIWNEFRPLIWIGKAYKARCNLLWYALRVRSAWCQSRLVEVRPLVCSNAQERLTSLRNTPICSVARLHKQRAQARTCVKMLSETRFWAVNTCNCHAWFRCCSSADAAWYVSS
jgi:hypothetical protein